MADGRHFLTRNKFTMKMKQNDTGHTESYLKRQAKKIKKEQNITHIQALDVAAVQSGFTNFKNFQNSIIRDNAIKNHTADTRENTNKNSQLKGRKKLDPYRNLLVAGINELLKKNLISLNSPENPNANDQKGHVFAEVLEYPSVIKWREIGFGELEISVWWKYDHSKHPQAELSGRSRESFNSTSPLARRELFPKFVGVTVTGWLERQKGKHLMGKDRERFVDVYTRKGEKSELEKMPSQKPTGFEAEGKFYF